MFGHDSDLFAEDFKLECVFYSVLAHMSLYFIFIFINSLQIELIKPVVPSSAADAVEFEITEETTKSIEIVNELQNPVNIPVSNQSNDDIKRSHELAQLRIQNELQNMKIARDNYRVQAQQEIDNNSVEKMSQFAETENVRIEKNLQKYKEQQTYEDSQNRIQQMQNEIDQKAKADRIALENQAISEKIDAERAAKLNEGAELIQKTNARYNNTINKWKQDISQLQAQRAQLKQQFVASIASNIKNHPGRSTGRDIASLTKTSYGGSNNSGRFASNNSHGNNSTGGTSSNHNNNGCTNTYKVFNVVITYTSQLRSNTKNNSCSPANISADSMQCVNNQLTLQTCIMNFDETMNGLSGLGKSPHNDTSQSNSRNVAHRGQLISSTYGVRHDSCSLMVVCDNSQWIVQGWNW